MDLPWRYGLRNIFCRNKTFLFFNIESWNFQHLFEKKIVKPHKISTQSDNWLKKWKLEIVWIGWMSWNFVRCHKIQFQTDSESFSFLSWKTKKFFSWKKYCLSLTTKIDPKDGAWCPNFQWRFWSIFRVVVWLLFN